MSGLTARRDRGQALVEVALIVPVFLLLLMALFDFGRAVYAYNTVSEAARNGARVAIVNQTSSDICGTAAGRAVALGLPTACVAGGSPTVGVRVTASTGGSTCTKINCVQSVTVTYRFIAITPIVSTIIGPITVSSTSRSRWSASARRS
jgi:Flp pilus assembly protein TadG